MSKARAKKIKLLLFDVDGVLTDGKIWLFPAPAGFEPMAAEKKAAEHAHIGGYSISSSSMMEAKGFNAHDGTAISLARLGGLKTGLITKRISETVALRARSAARPRPPGHCQQAGRLPFDSRAGKARCQPGRLRRR